MKSFTQDKNSALLGESRVFVWPVRVWVWVGVTWTPGVSFMRALKGGQVRDYRAPRAVAKRQNFTTWEWGRAAGGDVIYNISNCSFNTLWRKDLNLFKQKYVWWIQCVSLCVCVCVTCTVVVKWMKSKPSRETFRVSHLCSGSSSYEFSPHQLVSRKKKNPVKERTLNAPTRRHEVDESFLFETLVNKLWLKRASHKEPQGARQEASFTTVARWMKAWRLHKDPSGLSFL